VVDLSKEASVTGPEGRLVAGRYRLEHRVGDGGMGAVWRALDERLDRVVAVKQLQPPVGLSQDEADQARQRVFREARIAARLQHPNAIAVYDAADDDGQPVLVMEYLPSRSLATVLAEHGPLPPGEAARIGAQIASALAAAHAAGIVHRDVKPGNILLGEDGTAKIGDFGISHATGDVTVTRTGLLAGTPAFLSPEAARGERPGPASDVFSLGATLYAAVEGIPPFGDGDNPIALLHRVAAGQVAPPRRAGALAEPLMRMLRDDPAARPTMAQLVESLKTAGPAPTRLDLRPLSAAPETPMPALAQPEVEPARRPTRRTTYTLLALLSAGVLALLVAALLARPDQSASTADSTPPTSTDQPPTADSPSPDLLRQAVTDYYALLPDDTEQAWARLGPDLRAQGRQRYEEFWRDVKDLKVITPPEASGDTVVVEIEYTTESRGRVRETHRLGMLVDDGVPLINSDQLLASVEGKEDDDKKGKKKDGEGRGDN
jgi:serine/threonine protein kinase